MMQPNSPFRDDVYKVVAQIPYGRLMTYGQIAALCGQPRAARIVGQIAHFGPSDLPWQRVVSKNGLLASGFYGGKEGHKQALEQEGVPIDEYQVLDLATRLWWPPK